VSVLIATGDDRCGGILQYSANSDVTYHQVAERLARRLTAHSRLVQPQRAADSGETIEHVPSHTTLDSERARRHFGMSAPDAWQTVDWLFEQLDAS
jgi:dTDP-4-dehydrorhamnose reductase